MAYGLPSNACLAEALVIVFVLSFAIACLVAFTIASSILSNEKRRS